MKRLAFAMGLVAAAMFACVGPTLNLSRPKTRSAKTTAAERKPMVTR